MFALRGVFRENGATAVLMAAISSTLLILGRVVTMLNLETRLMFLSWIWASLYLLQRVMVGKRRTSGHWFVQYTAMAGYYLPAPLVFYVASSVSYSTSSINEFSPFLMLGIRTMFALTLTFSSTGSAVLFTNMKAYSLRDHAPRDRHNFLRWLVLLACVDWEWVMHSSALWMPVDGFTIRVIVYLLPLMFLHYTALSFLFGSIPESIMDCNTKAVHDYMKRESRKTSGTPFFDNDAHSLQLHYCRYPFVQGKDGEWVTVKDLVQLDGLSNEDQDICLAYSLCRLLARRYYGFHCTEEGDANVRRFALTDLGRTGGGYKRAFTIVEVQLAFLHDYFFTASLPIIQSVSYDPKMEQRFAVMLAVVLHMCGLEATPGHVLVLRIVKCLEFVVLCMYVPGCLLFGKPVLPLQHILASYWRPIDTAFRTSNDLPDDSIIINRFRPNPNSQDGFHLFQAQIGGAYWRNKLGQYSILQDYNRHPTRKKKLVAWFQGTMLSQPSYGFINHLPVEEEEEDMLELDSMRKLVADTLEGICKDGLLTNGTRSLARNMDKINKARKVRDGAGCDCDWLGTCREETHTHTILIWHIATCYCDMTPISNYLSVKQHHEPARALSRYCAYLVAFLPEFLPEHSLTTKQVFQRVLQEAQDELGKTPMQETEKYTKMQLLPRKRTTFHKGVELGRQLQMIDDDKVRWEVIAEFWAETILYIAPSDNAEAHIEQLAKGGEFITHLWAMLSNAGILKRATGEWHQPPACSTIDGPPTHQLVEELSSSNEASTSSMSSPPIQTSEPPTNEKGKQLLEDHEQ